MSAQLFKLIAQLDREGATELAISVGRPVALRVNGTYQPVTPSAVTMQQLDLLFRGTPVASLLVDAQGVGELRELELGGRVVWVQVIRNGADLMVRFEASKRGVQPPAARTQLLPTTLEPQVRFATPGTRTQPIPTVTTRSVDVEPAPMSAVERLATARAQAVLRTQPIARTDPTDPTTAATTGVTTGATIDAMPARPATTQPLPRPVAAPPASPVTAGGLVDEPSTMTPGLAALVRDARARHATDLHVAAGRPVMVRAVGQLVALDPAIRTREDVDALLLPMLGEVRRAQLEERGYVDIAIEVPGAGRLRGNLSRHQGGLKGAFRIARATPPTLAEIGLPADLAKVTQHHQGLVVIAGPSGHGKTTTLAALVDLLNSSDPIHILTIEDPVEIVHPRKAAVITQREVGRHTMSFAAALKASLREDPDVIVIGELRDRETVEIAMTAAETGHLVLATMSTPSAAKTIDRLIDMFPPDDQSQVRASLAGALRAIVAQRLLPSANGDSLVAVIELVIGSLPLATLIRDNKLYQLPNLMQRGRSLGMVRLDESLAEHVRQGRITEEVALAAADSKRDLHAVLHPVDPNAAAAPKSRFGGLFGGKKDKA